MKIKQREIPNPLEQCEYLELKKTFCSSFTKNNPTMLCMHKEWQCRWENLKNNANQRHITRAHTDEMSMRKYETLQTPASERPTSPICPYRISFLCVTIGQFLLREPITAPWPDILQSLFSKPFEIILQQLHCGKWASNANYTTAASMETLILAVCK